MSVWMLEKALEPLNACLHDIVLVKETPDALRGITILPEQVIEHAGHICGRRDYEQ
jgi:hypothetical protein